MQIKLLTFVAQTPDGDICVERHWKAQISMTAMNVAQNMFIQLSVPEENAAEVSLSYFWACSFLKL